MPGTHAAAANAAAILNISFWFYYIVAFLLSAIVNGINLATTSYPRRFFLIRRCWHFYVYCISYGVLAALLLWIFPMLKEHGIVEIEPKGGGMWTAAVLVGLFSNSLLHTRFGTINDIPIGPETVITDDIPDTLTNDIQEQIKQDIKDSESVNIALQRYLGWFGETNLKELFPLT
ncbi:MAG: hypothetical protein ACLQVD_08115 [Capsulimonadaceae bacterium]